MLTQKLGKHAGDDAGFTLIELLVVTVILAILAGIAIPAFFAQRNKATDAVAKVYARTARTAIEAYSTDHDSSYVGASPGALSGLEPTLVNANLSLSALSASGFTVTVTSDTGNTFQVVRNGGSVTFPCQAPATFGCPASGFWNK